MIKKKKLISEYEKTILGFHSREKAEINTVSLESGKMKEAKYTKSLTTNQVYAIVHMRDIRKNGLPKFYIKLCMETPCLCPFHGHNCGRRKPTETSVLEFSYLFVNSSLEKLIKTKVIFILRQGMFR